MAQVIWTRSAMRHLREIDDYLSQRSPEHAAKVLCQLRDAPKLLATSPRLGRVVPDYGREDVRELVTVKPYRIVYLLQEDTCRVLAVVHSRRLLQNVIRPEDLDFEEERNGT
jgi:plasmid stabilization system protein ParE